MSLDDRPPEEQAYWDEHFRLYGHHPLPDLTGRHQCAHPIHDAMKQAMNQPGIVLEFPFDVRSVFTLDDPEVQEHEADYQKTVSEIRSYLREQEERDKRNDSGVKEIF